MAYDKIIPVTRRLDKCARYVTNPEKTALDSVQGYIANPEKAHLVTALNCQTSTACQEMLSTKRRWGKTGGVLGYHLIHSYAPGEVTPEQAHAAGVEFARRLLGDRYEAVIATHVDREHLHCHILFNSVSFVDGKKYRNSFQDYFGDIRETSNQVSREQGLSTIQPQGRGESYPAWQAEKTGRPTLRSLVRADIDRVVRQAFTLQSLWRILENWGYDVKRGQHIALRPPGGKRFLRLDSLGGGYTEAVLLQRIARNRVKRVNRTYPKKVWYRGLWKLLQPHPRLRGFRALYFHYLYLLRGNHRRPTPFVVQRDVFRLRQMVEEYRFLMEHQIDTTSQLADFQRNVESQIKSLVEWREPLYREGRKKEIAHINEELRPLRKQLRLCGAIAQRVPQMRENLRSSTEEPNPKEKQRNRGEITWM